MWRSPFSHCSFSEKSEDMCRHFPRNDLCVTSGVEGEGRPLAAIHPGSEGEGLDLDLRGGIHQPWRKGKALHSYG